jgi:hypothetical protein
VSWRSPAYDHYTISLIRAYHSDGITPRVLQFQFNCRFGNMKHVKIRDRMKTSDGTKRLLSSANTCDNERGVSPLKNALVSSDTSRSTYSPVRHRTLIALRAVSSHRAMNFVNDVFYQREVEMFRPGTSIPSPSTVSRDINNLYEHGSRYVSRYLVSFIDSCGL